VIEQAEEERHVAARANAHVLVGLRAVRVKRGSATITLQPFSLACSVCSIDTGCASAAFEPKNSSDFEFCSSLYELVIAP